FTGVCEGSVSNAGVTPRASARNRCSSSVTEPLPLQLQKEGKAKYPFGISWGVVPFGQRKSLMRLVWCSPCMIAHDDSPRLLDTGCGAVPADAHPCAGRGRAHSRLPEGTRSARTCRRHALPADAACVPARARHLPRGEQAE